ncbi:GntR family transcriptional regulator [Zhengella sp. ZM62]|uniref:GntR family transcriptional regulator n=1 Tax=Zhengella sedimenti TaxID=3390035 RepID=UPI0039758BD1
MKILPAQPSLTEQVYTVIVDEICSGALPEGAHLVQEQLAARLGVSRQPVQQAMALLKADGLVEEVGRRGLYVTPLDIDLMRQHYEIRAVLDGLATRMAAEQVRRSLDAARTMADRGQAILVKGQAAVASGDVAEQVRQDEAFHNLIYDHSGNALVARTAEPHWRFLRRAMGEVLRSAKLPADIWRQHGEILHAVLSGDAAKAEQLAVEHDLNASETLYAALVRRQAQSA